MSIVFEFSRDPALLEQYYQLRGACFRKDLGLDGFDGSEEEQDRQGRIFLAHQGGRCLGGSRVSTAIPIAVHGHLSGLDLLPKNCCMWERAAMDRSSRTPQMFIAFCSRLIQCARALGHKHAVVLSTLRISRFYRQCHSALGIKFNIHGRVPECARGAFAHLDHYLSISQLHDYQTRRIAA